MTSEDQDFRSAHEIGKIYDSLTEKGALCDFFLESVCNFIHAEKGELYFVGKDDQIWMEAQCGGPAEIPESVRSAVQTAVLEGKPVKDNKMILVPLIVRNSIVGVGRFERNSQSEAFSEKELELAFVLASEMASSIKNVLLFEQTLQMERLAAVGKTMGMVIHEMKNIIQLAKFSEEWLRKGVTEHSQRHLERGMEWMNNFLKEIEGFVYEILSLTKDYQIVPQKTDLRKLLVQLQEDLTPRAKDAHTQLDFQIDRDFPREVDSDFQSLYRALLNMVKNALEASDKEDAYVRIRVKSADTDHYQIVIEDNGIGMSDKVKAQLFQALMSTKGEKGTGLGLMIVERTVKALKGAIQFQSEKGKGTQFTFTFPYALPNTETN